MYGSRCSRCSTEMSLGRSWVTCYRTCHSWLQQLGSPTESLSGESQFLWIAICSCVSGLRRWLVDCAVSPEIPGHYFRNALEPTPRSPQASVAALLENVPYSEEDTVGDYVPRSSHRSVNVRGIPRDHSELLLPLTGRISALWCPLQQPQTACLCHALHH